MTTDESMPVEAIICPICNGMGEYSVRSDGPPGDEWVSCDNCEEKGWMIP